MSVKWKDTLSVGNNLVDEDHKKLIEMVNLVEESLTSDCASDEIVNILHDLDNLTADHFQREELLMQKINFPGYHTHSDEHRDLMTRFTALKSDIILNLNKKQQISESEALIDLLRHWLIDHVINEDKRLKPYFKKFPPDFC